MLKGEGTFFYHFLTTNLRQQILKIGVFFHQNCQKIGSTLNRLGFDLMKSQLPYSAKDVLGRAEEFCKLPN